MILTQISKVSDGCDYIHTNPVVSGFVLEPKDWKYSSAIDYCGGQGLLKLYHL
jgi:hypothetical protein